jgi:hypothetical protein
LAAILIEEDSRPTLFLKSNLPADRTKGSQKTGNSKIASLTPFRFATAPRRS